jgi:hypothetical protein
MSGDFYKEWRDKAQIDFFPHLTLMWLSTNAWYRSHYSEIKSKKDRDFINVLHGDNSGRNKLYKQMDLLLDEQSKRGIAFLSHLESLFYALNTVNL